MNLEKAIAILTKTFAVIRALFFQLEDRPLGSASRHKGILRCLGECETFLAQMGMFEQLASPAIANEFENAVEDNRATVLAMMNELEEMLNDNIEAQIKAVSDAGQRLLKKKNEKIAELNRIMRADDASLEGAREECWRLSELADKLAEENAQLRSLNDGLKEEYKVEQKYGEQLCETLAKSRQARAGLAVKLADARLKIEKLEDERDKLKNRQATQVQMSEGARASLTKSKIAKLKKEIEANGWIVDEDQLEFDNIIYVYDADGLTHGSYRYRRDCEENLGAAYLEGVLNKINGNT